MAHLLAALPPGSHLALSHATLDPLPADTSARLAALTNPDVGHGTFRPRTRSEIARFLDGLTLADPGLVPIVQWRPDQPPVRQPPPAQAAASLELSEHLTHGGELSGRRWGEPGALAHFP